MAMGFFVKIGADASEAIEALGRVRDRTTDLERGLMRIQRNLNSFGSAATKGLTVPIVATTTAMALATREAMKFNKGMAEVSTLLKNVSQKDFEMMRKQTLAFSTQMGIASNEVVPALYQAISAGIPKENVFTFLETAGKASIAGVTSLETSVDGLTSVVNAYGQDVISVEKASDLMFTTVRLGKTNFEQLSSSLYNVIPIASSLGVSFSDVSAALATITIQGTPTAQATTQLRSALVELSKEGSKTDKIFRDLAGKSFQDFIASGGDLQGALQLLETHANKTGKSISASFSSVEAAQGVLQLTGKSADSFSASLNEMSYSANATNTAFEKMELDESREFEKIKVEIHNLVIELGQNLLPIIRDDLLPLFKDTLIPIAQKLVEKIGELATKFNDLPSVTQNAMIGFMGLLAVIGPAAIALSGLIGTITSLKAAWIALNLTVSATPIGIIVTLTALIAALTISAAASAIEMEKLRRETMANAEATIKLKKAFEKLNTETNTLVTRYQQLAEKTKLTKEEQAELEIVTTRLKDLYPDLNVVIDENGKAMITNIGITYDDIAARKERIKVMEKESETELQTLLQKQQTQLQEYEKTARKLKDNPNGGGSYYGGLDNSTRLITVNKNIKDTQKHIEDTEKKLNELGLVKDDVLAGGGSGKDPQTKALEKKIKLLENQLKLQNDNNNAQNNSTGGGVPASNNNPPEKGFADYLADLETSLKIYDQQQESLKKINDEYSETSALQERNSIITSGITQMAKELSLTEEQALRLGDTYGSAFESGETVADFDKMKSAILENIAAYEEEITVRRELGEVIKDADVAIGKDDIAKQGILEIVNALLLTEEQVQSLKAEFGNLFEDTKNDGQNLAEWWKEDWQNVTNEILGFTSDMFGNANSIFQNAIQQQIDALEGRKTSAIEAIDEELKAYLKSNKAMEKTEADRLKDSITDIKKRQKVALGLYEQERLQKELKEQQADLLRITAEENAATKKLEIEKNYTNEIMRLKHKQDMANWATQLAQATASGAQAIINAVVSGMAVPPPGNLVMVPLLTSMASVLTATQIAAIAVSKPPEPQYLADGGIIRRRSGGMNAIIGEGNFNEAVIPLKDDVLAGIGNAMANATNNREVISNQNISNDSESEIEYRQPIMLNIDGKTVGGVILGLTKRGVKVVHQRGIIG